MAFLPSKKELKKISIRIIVFFALLFIFSYPFVLTTIADLRAVELKILFDRSHANSPLISSTSILARYKIWKNRSKQKIENSKDYINEIKLLSIINSNKRKRNFKFLSFTLFKEIGFIFINGLNTLAGDTFIFGEQGNKKWNILELAYYEERKRKFSSASAIYSIALKYFRKEKNILSNIYLHRGFCRSMINQFNGASKDYKKVILLNTNSDLAMTADLLLVLLKDKYKEIQKIKTKKDSLRKAVMYYKKFSFYNSLQVLLALKENRNQKYYFYRARVYEEIGQYKKAVEDYKKVIAMNSNNAFSINANRRLFILGVFYEKDDKLKEFANKNFIKTKDKAFRSHLEIFEKTSVIKKEKKQNSIKNKLAEEIKEKKIELFKDDKKINKTAAKTKIKNKEKMIKDDSVKKEQNDKKSISKNYILVDQIDTKEGNRFVGKILSINEYQIKMRTSVGIIYIAGNSVTKFSIRKVKK